MVGYVCIGALAAFGLLSMVWCMLGWLFGNRQDSVLLVLGEVGCLERLLWLRSLGLLRSRLVLQRNNPETRECMRLMEQGIELWSREDILRRLEMGAEDS